MSSDTFIRILHRLGLPSWDGIEVDIAWGYVTGLLGLHRPTFDGPIYIYRVPCLTDTPFPARVQITVSCNAGPEPVLADIAARFEDLADPHLVEPWRLVTIDTTRGASRNRELSRPCYILVDFAAFRLFGQRPHGLIEMVLGQGEVAFPMVLPQRCNAVTVRELLAPLLPTGLLDARWQASLNGEVLGTQLITCPEGFFLQVQVWGSITMLDNIQVGAPLLATTLHLEVEMQFDPQLVRVTVFIPGGNTLFSSRKMVVSCLQAWMEDTVTRNLRSRFPDLCTVGFHLVPAHPSVAYDAPIFAPDRHTLVLVYDDPALREDAVTLLRMDLPNLTREGAIFCPRQLRKQALVAQLGLVGGVNDQLDDLCCYVNNVDLLSTHACEVVDGTFLWCLLPLLVEPEVDLLSIPSRSMASDDEDTRAVLPPPGPQGLIGSAHYFV